MRQRNCPNCSAPYKIELNACPYCGTSYFDLSAINIMDSTPFYLKLKMDDMVFTSKVVVEPDININVSVDMSDLVDSFGTKVQSICQNRNCNIDMHFRSVIDMKGDKPVLYTVEAKG